MRAGTFALILGLALSLVFLPTRGGIEPIETYRIAATGSQPGTLDPAASYADPFAGHLIQNVYESLVSYSGNGTDSPELLLAESYSVSAGAVFTFKLRRDVRFKCYDTATGTFTDYGTLTAEDVKYSLDRAVLLRARGGPAWMFGAGGAEFKGVRDYFLSSHDVAAMDEYVTGGAVMVVDDHTVSIDVESGASMLLPVLATSVGSVYSRRWALEHPQTDAVYLGIKYRGTDSAYIGANVCSTGPYYLKEWGSDGRIVLERNDGWWQVELGLALLPSLRTVVYTPVADDGERTRLLLSGDVDTAAVSVGRLGDVSLGGDPDYPREGLQVVRFPTFDIQTLHMTMARAPLNDSKLRDALRYAFDYEGYIQGVTGSTARRLYSPLPEGMPCFTGANDPLLKRFDYDAGSARDLILAAGYNGSNMLRLTIGYVVEDTYWKAMATTLAYTLMTIEDADGFRTVDVTLDGVSLEEFVEKVFYAANPWEVPYDIYPFGWTPDYLHPQDYAELYSASYGDFAYYAGWKDDEADAALREAKEEPLDAGCPKYQAAARKVAQLGPFIFVAQLDGLAWQRNWVDGYYPASVSPMQSSSVRGGDTYGLFYPMLKRVPTTTTTSTTTTLPKPTPTMNVSLTPIMLLVLVIPVWLMSWHPPRHGTPRREQ